MGFKRNTEAEEFKNVLIPKDTTLLVGVQSANGFLNKMRVGPHRGRSCDKFKLRVKILQPDSEFTGETIPVGVTAAIERDSNGITAYGSSKKYCELWKAVDPKVTDDNVPCAEDDDAVDVFAQTFLGVIFNCTFGTYTWADKRENPPKEVTINTIKSAEPASADQLEALKAEIATWQAEIAATKDGGASSEYDDDNPPF